jgi:hypothetical protein
VIAIGVGRRHTKLLVDLIQQLFGLRCVSIHIEFVCLLGSGNFFKSLLRQPLCGGQVRMSVSGDVIDGKLGDRKTTSKRNKRPGLSPRPFLCLR